MIGISSQFFYITHEVQAAIKEATRDGAPAIDLVDGDQLVEKLKQLSLGVSTKKIEIEQVSIDHDWFLHL